MTQEPDDIVIIAKQGQTASLLLNRPKALNAISRDMISALSHAIEALQADADLELIVLEGAGGKALSAGADVRMVRELALAGDHAGIRSYFAAEYALDLAIAESKIPIVALVDGICFGGGMGLAMASKHCIASEKAKFSMPETLIGFVPDAGATFFLPPLPGRLGLYLGLTGDSISGADAVHLKLASHFIASSDLAALRQRLVDIGPAALDFAPTELPEFSLAPVLDQINRTFTAESLDEIFANLQAEGSDWARGVLSVLNARSPTALRRTFEMLTAPKSSLADCLSEELEQATIAIAHPDFAEGVRAALVDKDKLPKWQSGGLSVK